MNKQHDPLKYFIVSILIASSTCLLLLLFNIHTNTHSYIHTLIFATAMTMIIDSFQRKKIFHIITYFIIFVIYNPFTNPLISHDIWKAIHVMVLIFLLKNILEICYSDKVKETSRIAAKLNEYMRDLEKQISHLTFHETAMVINREYPKEYRLIDNRISWQDKDLPDFEFYVLSSYFSQGHRNKGGVSAAGKNEFDNIEIHLNFNLTHHVKYAVREEVGPSRTSLFGKQLKYMLIKKYEYVDMAKVIGN